MQLMLLHPLDGPMLARIRNMLSLLLLFSFLTIAQGQDCPLKFSEFQPPGTCKQTLDSIDCCLEALAYLSRTLAVHTNITVNQPLFLNNVTETACVKLAQIQLQPFVSIQSCPFGPPSFTAYTTGCNFGFLEELATNLSGFPATSFGQLVKSCKNTDATCLKTIEVAVLVLSSSRNDSKEACTSALRIALLSTDVYNSGWTSGLEAMLDSEPAPVNAGGQKDALSTKTMVKVLASLVFCLGLIVISLFPILYYWRWKRKHVVVEKEPVDQKKRDSNSGNSAQVSEKNPPHSEALYAFSRREIWKATKSFSEPNYIGQGSAGMVHKGILPSGQIVAVKHIREENKADTFFKEIESLSKVRHPNLVSLLGYCQSGQDYFLVYEYCSNGNLWQWLFGEGRALTWEERVNVAVGSARGLWFLHCNPGGSIIHRDVKPTNILLNDNLDAKLSDFGLSKFLAIEESHVFTEVKGTSGYLDPEYMSKGQLTLASDIYSFGIVLLQLLSGRRPIELEHRHTLIKTASKIVEKGYKVSKLMDPRLENKYSEPAAKMIVEIAFFCTAQSGNNRPGIKEVKDTLETAWKVSSGELETGSHNRPRRKLSPVSSVSSAEIER